MLKFLDGNRLKQNLSLETHLVNLKLKIEIFPP